MRAKKIIILFGLFFVITLFLINSINLLGHIKISLYPIVKKVEKYRILKLVDSYEELETENFIVKYKSNDIKSAKMTAQIAEKYYNKICSTFNYYPKDKTNIVIYNNKDELINNIGLKKRQAPIGVYYSGVINILSPHLWIKQDINQDYVFEKNGPIVHEFTHLIVDEISNGNYPMWLTEGLALYTEYMTTGFEWGRNIVYNQEVNIKDLNENFKNIDQNIAYRKSFEIVKNMDNKWGFEKIVTILNNLGEGNSMTKTVRAVLKIQLKDIK